MTWWWIPLFKSPLFILCIFFLSPPSVHPLLTPILIKTRCGVCCLSLWHFAVYLPDTGWGQDPRKRRADLCFQRTAGKFGAKFLRGKRQGPDPAHLRVLWWNNSKCLSCIVWHAAGGVLKPLLPVPKAPLNKMVENKSFILIFPLDYCAQGGKLAADPRASLFLWHCHNFIWKCLPSALLLCPSARPL